MTNAGAWVFGGEQGKGLILKVGEAKFFITIEGKRTVVRKSLAAAMRYAKRVTDYTVLAAVA